MTGTVENTRNWSEMDIYVADLGTTAPTDVDTPWGVDWTLLGFLDEDSGLEQAQERSVTSHFAYGGAHLRDTVKGQRHTFKFMALEHNRAVHKLHNPQGAPSTVGGLTVVHLKNWKANPQAFGIELRDGDVTQRYAIARGDTPDAPTFGTITDDGMQGFTFTLVCYSDSTETWADLFTNDPAMAA